MLEKQVKIRINNKEDVALILFENNKIKFTYLDQEWVGLDDIPFIALKKLRQQLENKDILISVNGSRKDVFPSGMQMNMGMTSAYINVIGKGGGEVVDIFEECDDFNLISTVNDQEQFHENWLNSIK